MKVNKPESIPHDTAEGYLKYIKDKKKKNKEKGFKSLFDKECDKIRKENSND